MNISLDTTLHLFGIDYTPISTIVDPGGIKVTCYLYHITIPEGLFSVICVHNPRIEPGYWTIAITRDHVDIQKYIDSPTIESPLWRMFVFESFPFHPADALDESVEKMVKGFDNYIFAGPYSGKYGKELADE
jgi:hypothetical protein